MGTANIAGGSTLSKMTEKEVGGGAQHSAEKEELTISKPWLV